MHIIVSGKHLELGESLQAYATQFVQKHIMKYFNNAVNAHITISKDVDAFHTHISVNDGTGVNFLINADATDADAYKSVERAVKKIEKQLERYKDRIKNHRKIMDEKPSVEATKYIINDFDYDDTSDLKYNDQGSPLSILSEKQLTVEVLSVQDAVMHMNLQNIPTIMFVNADNHKLSMVYYKNDKNIALVETTIDMSHLK